MLVLLLRRLLRSEVADGVSVCVDTIHINHTFNSNRLKIAQRYSHLILQITLTNPTVADLTWLTKTTFQQHLGKGLCKP